MVPVLFSLCLVKLIPPSKPNVTKLSDTSVMLHWSVPPNDGLRITFFKIQYKEITDNQRKTGWRTVDKDISPLLFSFKVDTGLKTGPYRDLFDVQLCMCIEI